jgi:hypothetical protein
MPGLARPVETGRDSGLLLPVTLARVLDQGGDLQVVLTRHGKSSTRVPVMTRIRFVEDRVADDINKWELTRARACSSAATSGS